MTDKLKTYKLIHYYTTDELKYSVFIQTEIEEERLIKILGAMNFKFEELVDDSLSMDENHIVNLLERFYPVKNVTEEYRPFLPSLQIPMDKWEIINYLWLKEKQEEIIQIDLYDAREACCGAGYKTLMDDHLPQTTEFEDAVKDISDYPYYEA